MIHPDTELRHVNKEIGYGVFATKFIPKGTVVYVKDALEIVVSPNDPRMQDPHVAAVIKKYSYLDAVGDRIVSWDLARYVNHCCNSNTVTTGYGFEIAIRDIAEGEEITDDYGLFNLDYDITLTCSKPNCRMMVRKEDLLANADRWDTQIRAALNNYKSVDQPLEKFMEVPTRNKLYEYLDTGANFLSVRCQKFDPDKIRKVTRLQSKSRVRSVGSVRTRTTATATK